MLPELLRYCSALEILKFVAANEGARNWYGITLRVDLINGVEKTPPVFHVLRLLVQQGYLRTEPPDESNEAVYFLTKQGRDALDELLSSPP